MAEKIAYLPGVQPPTSSGGGNGGDMEARLAKLETRLDTQLPNLATKADIADVKSDIFKWGSTFGIALAAIIVTVLAVIINRNQTPAPITPAPIITAPAPIVIYPNLPAASEPNPKKK